MDVETQALIDALRDKMAGMTPKERYAAYTHIIDGYRMITYISSEYQYCGELKADHE